MIQKTGHGEGRQNYSGHPAQNAAGRNVHSGGLMAWYDPALWNWGAISQTAIAAGAGSFAFTWLQRWLEGRRHGAYLALRLAIILEEFASDCLELIYDNRNHWSSRGVMGMLRTRLPDLKAFPDDDSGWKALRIALAEKVLTFPSKVADSRSRLRSIWETEASSEEALTPYCSDQAAECGLEAARLAALLRHDYDYPQMQGDLLQRLTEQVMEIRERDSRWKESQDLHT